MVIRSRNEARNLAQCLERLKRQTEKPEIILVDSGSTDETVTVAEHHGCIVIQCTDFTYGKGLNDGIKASKGEYIAILSGHCFPTDKLFLSILKKNLFVKKIAGVYARQIPHKDTNPLEFRNFFYTYRMEPSVQHQCPFFNNGASMIRREIWEEVPFNEAVKAQEDVLWAMQVQQLGYSIAYEPRAIVEHLHSEDTFETVKRYIKEYEVLKEIKQELSI